MNVATSDINRSVNKDRSTNTFNRSINAFVFLLVGVMVFMTVGCASPFEVRDNLRRAGYPDKLFEGYRDYVWAQRAFNLRYGNCNIANREDFQNGFAEGYCDMCEGGTGHAPAVPPNEYWGDRYQTGNGSKLVDAWYRGYPEGVRAAKQDGATRHNKMYMSKEMLAAVQQGKKSKITITAEDFRKVEQNQVFPDPTQPKGTGPAPVVSPGMRGDTPPSWNPADDNQSMNWNGY